MSIIGGGRLIGVLIAILLIGLFTSPPRFFFLYVGILFVVGGYLLLATATWFAIMLIAIGCGSMGYGAWTIVRGVAEE